MPGATREDAGKSRELSADSDVEEGALSGVALRHAVSHAPGSTPSTKAG